ncbi:glycogen debranching protein GlgX [Mycobacterium sp. 852002-51057_SCH5723018]|uniref:glycogen debranching protein GlgX n=1 Tax=Mycobacterium sp. 852002-51057_SCH5723018 TaxID=1834094 RepID=UPI0007FC3F81|nr:glycogen debranching protein GlgX [Mycobacterium sp. 852002-51057_SCH5723018]OBG24564.1 glycogen debranching enzyme GlgX [Mycobacterium sp. 852002-51057_SCH5723018]
MTPKILPGRPDPLGATPDPRGTNFAVACGGDEVTLCLFDADGAETQLVLPERDGDVWHGFVPGVGAGQAYGFRVGGPFDPGRGLRYNPTKLLLDPYARAIAGDVRFGPEVLGHAVENPAAPSPLDSAGHVPRSLVAAAAAGAAAPKPQHALADTVLYEVHVRGFTATHPGVPKELCGTYAGLAHEAALQHLVDLGVTAVELLPVHRSVPEQFLVERGLTNYWGYNTIGFFAPQANYSAAARAGQAGGEVAEFRAMVDALHAAGLEVILDVVFNHTAEGGAGGPTLCFRGLYNPAYYRLVSTDRSSYYDTTGTGNSLNTDHPTTLRLIMDSLRYWLSQMGVDGFRFDLAPTLGREDGSFDPMSAFFDLVAQDPVVSEAKLIAEPWDVGQLDSYEIGRFPPLWSEWNGRFRDTVRDWWRSQDGRLGDFASRLCGSSDIYGDRVEGRRPSASVNFVTVHDGFTLNDLVSYNQKHNEANGEGNRDGTDDNRSWNCGVEGPTDDPGVLALRAQQKRAFLLTLLLSGGVPMLLGGDELGRTQRGNNNAYCQDNEITWFDWAAVDDALLGFTTNLVALRRRHPVFRRRRFLTGAAAADLRWFTPSGAEMTPEDWADPSARSIAVFIDGATDPDVDTDGTALIDDDFLVFVNAWWEPLSFSVPADLAQHPWDIVCDTFNPTRTGPAAQQVDVGPRSGVVMRSGRPGAP